ncbi:Clavaminate synthase-like protein [Rhizodiscina lignyota]|uniref:Clavaminate synthase-like protein n=1 Tax=Rhizodiscina lignyota TaxID=1504668 RepID=A0A9P4IS08_9PEZI|nr:Clavaminate synthase-like protein [Rhizodiscina lignyota]
MSTATQTTTSEGTIPIKPTPVWVPFTVEGEVPPPYRTPKFGLKVIPLHPTFACELEGVDWSKPVPQEVYEEIRDLCDKYGVVVCRNTGLSDKAHVEFSQYFGDLDDVGPYQQAGRTHRLPYLELFDAGNIDPATGDVAPLTAAQVIGNKANEQFHVDSSFNGRRAGHSLLLAHILPPADMGGATEFSDSRTAYGDLSAEKKKQIENLVANHSLFHSRKKAVPHYFKDLDPRDHPFSKHKLVQRHEWSDRMNLYIASYCHSIDGMSDEEGTALIEELLWHVSQPKYRYTVPWKQEKDLIIWDNTSVMHRATGGTYEGKFRRDMRRTTVKDMSTQRFGLNGDGADWRVGMP